LFIAEGPQPCCLLPARVPDAAGVIVASRRTVPPAARGGTSNFPGAREATGHWLGTRSQTLITDNADRSNSWQGSILDNVLQDWQPTHVLLGKRVKEPASGICVTEP
jgi:hypothetical protein